MSFSDLFESHAGRFVVKVMWLPMPDSVWIEDRDEQNNETVYYPVPSISQFECGCGFRTPSETDIAHHLAKEHGIMDPDREVDFWAPYYCKKDLPEDAEIVPQEAYVEKQKRDTELPYIC